MTNLDITGALPKPSFMSANFLGREKDYTNVTWADSAAIAAALSPAATYAERIGILFEEIAAMGFTAVDLWTAHCNPAWVTPQHLKGLRAAMEKHGLVISSLAGGMGPNLQAFESICSLAKEVGAPVLGVGGGLLPDQIGPVAELLDRYQVSLGFENHPNEKTPTDVLTKICHGAYPRVGATLDTGWFATHGYPVLEAIDELKEHLLLVHLKNIENPGAHEAAAWDKGCLDLEPIVRHLVKIGYSGYISVEYEPLTHDPTPSCIEARKKVEEWIVSAAADARN